MLREKLLKKIEEIQKENETVTHYPRLSEVCEPGESGFRPRKVGTTGYLLISDVPVEPRKRRVIIDEKYNKFSLEDFRGVHPFMAIVMESSSETIKPGDVVLIDVEQAKHNSQDVVVKSALATVVPESIVLGVDQNLSV